MADSAVPTPGQSARGDRFKALLAVLPFLTLGLIDVLLLLFWGINPLWGFMILPPILAICVLAWIAFKSGFVSNRGEEPADGR